MHVLENFCSLNVNCFGTGNEAAAIKFLEDFDFRPAEIIDQLELKRPIYRLTTNYGHFGRQGLPWEDKRKQKPT
jgi:S-adenosylmethionine synthetase